MAGTEDPTSSAPQPAAGPGPGSVPPRGGGGGRWRRDVALVVGTALAVVVLQAVLVHGDDDGVSSDTTASTASRPDDGTTSAPESSSTTEGSGSRERRGNFEDGFWVVGEEVQPGRYISRPQTGACSWGRFADIRGDNIIVSQDRRTHQVIVDILATDKAFSSDNCGVWEIYEPSEAPPSTTIEEGDWIVGEQIEPGTYHTESASGCGWERTLGFEHTAQQLIDSLPAIPRPLTTLTVDLAAGEGFSTHDCGTWAKSG
jgi:hypothetical protein